MSLTALPQRALAAAVTVAAVLVWAGTVINKVLDPDESQHLHAAWLVGQGRVPFADFWEHHSPLLYYLLAPLTRVLADDPAVYFAGRALMALTTAGALCLVYRLARRLSCGAALAAVTLLAFLPRFVEHATEVRPDVPALLAWLVALLLLVRWGEAGGAWRLWAAALAAGVAVAFTPKAAYGLPGIAAAVLLGERRRGPGAAARVAAGWARLAAGAGLPVLALVAGLGLHGGGPALDGFAEHVLARALDFADLTREGPVSEEGIGFVLLGLAGLALAAWRERRTLLARPLHRTLLPPLAATVVVLLAPTTPAVYRHAWLPVLAVAAIYAGEAMATAWRRSPALAALAVAVGVIGPATIAVQRAVVDGNATQLAVMRAELARACPGEPVLDGTALYVFRPAAYRYHVLMRGIRKWIAEGFIPEERIVEDVRRARPPVAHADSRLRALVGPMADFLTRYYVPLPDGLLAAGAVIRPVPHDGGRAEVELLLTGIYRLRAGPGAADVAIDRQPVRAEFVRLEAGRHEVSWRGRVGSIQLAVLGCAERRALGRAASALSP